MALRPDLPAPIHRRGLALALLPLLAACGAAPAPAPEPTVALDARGGFIVGGLPAHLAWPRGTRVAVRGVTVALAPVAERPNTSVAGRPVARLPALGDAAGHEAARAIGRRHRADLVVWGAARCDPTGCVLPRFTVVDPERLYAPTGSGSRCRSTMRR